MSGSPNRQIVLVRRPIGDITDDCFEQVDAPVPQPADGEAVVRVRYLSLDPAQRGWMSDQPSYLPPMSLGEVVRSAGAGEVIASRNLSLPIGMNVMGLLGWQDYAVVGANTLSQPLPPEIDLVDALSVFGSTGITAYIGVLDIGKPHEGETFVVSGAAGGVGSIAGQIAKILGARVIGIAGSDEKCAWVVDDLGFDACVNYRSDDVEKRLRELCPDGIDVYFDNVGGPILEAVLSQINMRARIVLCGAISQYNDVELPQGPRNLSRLIGQRGRMEGFILLDHLARFGEAVLQLGAWVREGRLRSRVHMVEGLERAPQAINMLFSGENTGKLLVKVS